MNELHFGISYLWFCFHSISKACVQDAVNRSQVHLQAFQTTINRGHIPFICLECHWRFLPLEPLSVSIFEQFFPLSPTHHYHSVSYLLPEWIRHARDHHKSRCSSVPHHRQLHSVWPLPLLQGNSGYPEHPFTDVMRKLHKLHLPPPCVFQCRCFLKSMSTCCSPFTSSAWVSWHCLTLWGKDTVRC